MRLILKWKKQTNPEFGFNLMRSSKGWASDINDLEQSVLACPDSQLKNSLTSVNLGCFFD